MTYLIDGYNLMYAAGLATRAMRAAQFDRARERFLDWLADGAGSRGEILVIFDAQQAPCPSLETIRRGVRVRFAFQKTADDVIEELVAVVRRPDRTSVVSNDARVREAARRAACAVLTCPEFVDWLISPPRAPGPDADSHAPEGDKPIPPITDEDKNEWLNAFSTPKPKPRR